jgi:methionyl-tRNA synthetase
MKNKFYITTAIDYVNSEPHVGHAYQKVIADVLARYHKLLGEDVFFLTGTDEHGQKIARSAESEKLTEKQFVDKIAAKFKDSWKLLNVNFNRFIRTTDTDHEKVVQEFIKILEKKGDIYKGFYEGHYCVGCEAFFSDSEAEGENYICPIHKKKLEKLKEETYFFKLSKYQKELLNLYKEHPEYIMPESRRNEIINRVKDGLQDLSITRTTFSWGVPFPLDKKHVVYVWFDALLNYLTGVGWPSADYRKYWPADVHLLGKDNAWFHCVIWPAMLISAGIKPAKTIFVHGFLTINGEKVSKSLGNVISPKYLAEKYGTDSVRYFLLRNISFGEDGDFSESALKERHNNELANKLGNLVSRVAGMAKAKTPKGKTDIELASKLKLTEIYKHMDNLAPDKALSEIFEFIGSCNEYVQEKQPWKLEGKEKDNVLYSLVDSIRIISILLWPFMPETCENINSQFNFPKPSIENAKFNLAKEGKINKAEILFEKYG